MTRPKAEMQAHIPDDPLPHKKGKSAAWWAIAGIAGALVVLLLTGCVSVRPATIGLQEIRYFQPVPDGVDISEPMFRAIAGTPPGSEWRSVGTFEDGRLVAWWQEREIR